LKGARLRKALLAVLAGMALVMAIGAGTALATRPKPEHKITICHATPPDTAANGYHDITVDVASVGYQNSGHQSEHDADIIPPWQYTDDGDTFSFPGKNWTDAGQAIWRNGCEVPDEEPPPVIDPAASITVGTCDNLDSTAFLDNSQSDVDVTFSVNGSDYMVDEGETQTVSLGAFEGTITVTVGEETLASDSVSYADCEVTNPGDPAQPGSDPKTTARASAAKAKAGDPKLAG
jgi:hypothetical protein